MNVVLVHGMGVYRSRDWWVPWLRYIRDALPGSVHVHPFTWDTSAVRPRWPWQSVKAWLEDLGHVVTPETSDRLAKRCDARAPALIVAHSLGSVLAYRAAKYFCERRHRLVTFGCPLVYVERGILPLWLPPIAKPQRVTRWANVWGLLDPISHPIFRGGQLKASDRNYCALATHDAISYLKCRSMRRALVWAARCSG